MGTKHHPSRLGGSAPVETVIVPELEVAAAAYRPADWWTMEGEFGGARTTPDAICRAYAGRVPWADLAAVLKQSRNTVRDYCRRHGYGSRHAQPPGTGEG